MLLEIVGLDEKWEQGIACEYETPEFSLHDGQDVLTHLPLAIQALYPTSEARRQLDFSQLEGLAEKDEEGQRNNEDEERNNEGEEMEAADGESEVADANDDEVRVVRNLTLNYFRSRLVEHHDILFQQHKLVWPQRNMPESPPNGLDGE